MTGQLEHPGIVPIYAIGQDSQGHPYYAMRVIQGSTFAAAIADYHRHPTEPMFRRLLRRFVDVCQTIAFSPDGKRLVGGCGTLVCVWDAPRDCLEHVRKFSARACKQHAAQHPTE